MHLIKIFNLKNIVVIFTISLLILLFNIRCQRNNIVELLNIKATINGSIENYDHKCDKGLLVYFDALSRIDQAKYFKIDSSGNFSVSFNIPHAIHNAALLQVCDHMFPLFLEPGTDLQIIIQDDSILFLSENGLSNRQLLILEDTLDKKFREEIEFLKTFKKNESDFDDYILKKTGLIKKKMAFIDAYKEEHPLNPTVVNVLKYDFHYSIAADRIRYRNEHTPNIGATKKLIKTYDINNPKAISSSSYNDYIHRIQEFYAEMQDFGPLIDIIKQAYPFSNDEIRMIDAYFIKDTSITCTDTFIHFKKAGFSDILIEHKTRYIVNNFLEKCAELPAGIGRDLILSQGLCKYYFHQIYIEPTEIEWHIIDELIESDFILQYLHRLNDSFLADSPEDSGLFGLPEDVKIFTDPFNEETLEKYKGKVVYLDFYSSWCIPCRKEIPYARKLANHFENEAVVFVYLCCSSKKNNWRKIVEKYNLKGHHYYINDDEYTTLSTLYGVRGFPTYILIDQKGRVVNKEAPPPSHGTSITIDIEILLEGEK